MTLFNWSKTVAQNDDADSSVNWRENQAPSTVNDSARAMMAAIAKWRDDLSGNLVTAGSSTVYTLTTNQVFTALTDGLMVAARMDEVNGVDPTLNVDGLGAKQIRKLYGTNVASGALLTGGVYVFVYDSTDDAWIVHSIAAINIGGDLSAIEALSGTGVPWRTAAETWALDDGSVAINFVIGDGVNVITTGIKGDFVIPFAGTITEAWLLADQTGSIVLDLLKDSYANAPPTGVDTITASAKPTLSAAAKSKDTTLTDWITSITADDIIRVTVDSITTCTRVTLTLIVERYT